MISWSDTSIKIHLCWCHTAILFLPGNLPKQYKGDSFCYDNQIFFIILDQYFPQGYWKHLSVKMENKNSCLENYGFISRYESIEEVSE